MSCSYNVYLNDVQDGVTIGHYSLQKTNCKKDQSFSINNDDKQLNPFKFKCPYEINEQSQYKDGTGLLQYVGSCYYDDNDSNKTKSVYIILCVIICVLFFSLIFCFLSKKYPRKI